MNRKMALALAGLALASGWATRARATLARENGFGAASAFIVDDSSYTTLPQEVGTFKSTTYFELGGNPATGTLAPGVSTDTGAWGGTNLPLGPGTLGVWVGRPNFDFNGLYAASQLTVAGLPAGFLSGTSGVNALSGLKSVPIAAGSTIANFAAGAPDAGRVDLIYDFDFSSDFNLAVGINRANTDERIAFGSAFTSYDAEDLGLSLGADLKSVAFLSLLQLGLQINEESQIADANPGGADNKFDSSAGLLALRVGGETAGEDGRFGRIELGLAMGGVAVKSEPNGGGAATDNGGLLTYNLGYSVGMSRERGMGLCGLMLYGNSGSDDNTNGGGVKNTYANDDLVLSTAGEVKIKEWLTARAGLGGSLINFGSTTSSTSPATTLNSSDNGLIGFVGPGAVKASMGLSLEFGDLIIDGVLNQNLLYTGTYLVSGQPNSLFSQVALTWRWD